MSEKQYYVKLNYEWGVDNEDGTFTPKNKGEVAWISMSYDDAALFDYHVVVPNLNNINTGAAEAGLMKSGNWPPPDVSKGKPA